MRKSYRRHRHPRKKRTTQHRRRRTRGGSSPGRVLATPWKRDIINRPAPHAGVQAEGHILDSSRPKSSKMINIGIPRVRGVARTVGVDPKHIADVAQSVAAMHTLRNQKNTGLTGRVTRTLGRGFSKLKNTFRRSPARTRAFGPLASPR